MSIKIKITFTPAQWKRAQKELEDKQGWDGNILVGEHRSGKKIFEYEATIDAEAFVVKRGIAKSPQSINVHVQPKVGKRTVTPDDLLFTCKSFQSVSHFIW